MKSLHIIQSKVIVTFDAASTKFHSFSDRLRPRCIEELILPSKVKHRLCRMQQAHAIQNMLLYGAAGTGKTTCADLLADESSFFVRRFNAALDRSVSDVSEIQAFAVSPSLYPQNKIAVLDEAESMTRAAQKALLTVIEDATAAFDRDYSTKFLLIANDAHKLIDPLKSRCLPISFNPYSVDHKEAMSTLLTTIKSRFEEIDAEYDERAVLAIIESSFPDFRTIANRIEFELL